MFRFYKLYSLYLNKMADPNWCVCEKMPRAQLHIPMTPDDKCNLCGLPRRPREDETSSGEDGEQRQRVLLERRRAAAAFDGTVRVKVAMRAHKPCNANKCYKCGRQPNPIKAPSPAEGYSHRMYNGRFGHFKRPRHKVSVPASTIQSKPLTTTQKRSVSGGTASSKKAARKQSPVEAASQTSSDELLWELPNEEMPRLVAMAHEVFNRPKHLQRYWNSSYSNLFVSDFIPLNYPITDKSGGAISKRCLGFKMPRVHLSEAQPPLSKMLADILAKRAWPDNQVEADSTRASGGESAPNNDITGNNKCDTKNNISSSADSANTSQFTPFDYYDGPSEDALVVGDARTMLLRRKSLYITPRPDLPSTRLPTFEAGESSDSSMPYMLCDINHGTAPNPEQVYYTQQQYYYTRNRGGLYGQPKSNMQARQLPDTSSSSSSGSSPPLRTRRGNSKTMPISPSITVRLQGGTQPEDSSQDSLYLTRNTTSYFSQDELALAEAKQEGITLMNKLLWLTEQKAKEQGENFNFSEFVGLSDMEITESESDINEDSPKAKSKVVKKLDLSFISTDQPAATALKSDTEFCSDTYKYKHLLSENSSNNWDFDELFAHIDEHPKCDTEESSECTEETELDDAVDVEETPMATGVSNEPDIAISNVSNDLSVNCVNKSNDEEPYLNGFSNASKRRTCQQCAVHGAKREESKGSSSITIWSLFERILTPRASAASIVKQPRKSGTVVSKKLIKGCCQRCQKNVSPGTASTAAVQQQVTTKGNCRKCGKVPNTKCTASNKAAAKLQAEGAKQLRQRPMVNRQPAQVKRTDGADIVSYRSSQAFNKLNIKQAHRLQTQCTGSKEAARLETRQDRQDAVERQAVNKEDVKLDTLRQGRQVATTLEAREAGGKKAVRLETPQEGKNPAYILEALQQGSNEKPAEGIQIRQEGSKAMSTESTATRQLDSLESTGQRTQLEGSKDVTTKKNRRTDDKGTAGLKTPQQETKKTNRKTEQVKKETTTAELVARKQNNEPVELKEQQHGGSETTRLESQHTSKEIAMQKVEQQCSKQAVGLENRQGDKGKKVETMHGGSKKTTDPLQVSNEAFRQDNRQQEGVKSLVTQRQQQHYKPVCAQHSIKLVSQNQTGPVFGTNPAAIAKTHTTIKCHNQAKATKTPKSLRTVESQASMPTTLPSRPVTSSKPNEYKTAECQNQNCVATISKAPTMAHTQCQTSFPRTPRSPTTPKTLTTVDSQSQTSLPRTPTRPGAILKALTSVESQNALSATKVGIAKTDIRTYPAAILNELPKSKRYKIFDSHNKGNRTPPNHRKPTTENATKETAGIEPINSAANEQAIPLLIALDECSESLNSSEYFSPISSCEATPKPKTNYVDISHVLNMSPKSKSARRTPKTSKPRRGTQELNRVLHHIKFLRELEYKKPNLQSVQILGWVQHKCAELLPVPRMVALLNNVTTVGKAIMQLIENRNSQPAKNRARERSTKLYEFRTPDILPAEVEKEHDTFEQYRQTTEQLNIFLLQLQKNRKINSVLETTASESSIEDQNLSNSGTHEAVVATKHLTLQSAENKSKNEAQPELTVEASQVMSKSISRHKCYPPTKLPPSFELPESSRNPAEIEVCRQSTIRPSNVEQEDFIESPIPENPLLDTEKRSKLNRCKTVWPSRAFRKQKKHIYEPNPTSYPRAVLEKRTVYRGEAPQKEKKHEYEEGDTSYTTAVLENNMLYEGEAAQQKSGHGCELLGMSYRRTVLVNNMIYGGEVPHKLKKHRFEKDHTSYTTGVLESNLVYEGQASQQKKEHGYEELPPSIKLPQTEVSKFLAKTEVCQQSSVSPSKQHGFMESPIPQKTVLDTEKKLKSKRHKPVWPSRTFRKQKKHIYEPNPTSYTRAVLEKNMAYEGEATQKKRKHAYEEDATCYSRAVQENKVVYNGEAPQKRNLGCKREMPQKVKQQQKQVAVTAAELDSNAQRYANKAATASCVPENGIDIQASIWKSFELIKSKEKSTAATTKTNLAQALDSAGTTTERSIAGTLEGNVVRESNEVVIEIAAASNLSAANTASMENNSGTTIKTMVVKPANQLVYKSISDQLTFENNVKHNENIKQAKQEQQVKMKEAAAYKTDPALRSAHPMTPEIVKNTTTDNLGPKQQTRSTKTSEKKKKVKQEQRSELPKAIKEAMLKPIRLIECTAGSGQVSDGSETAVLITANKICAAENPGYDHAEACSEDRKHIAEQPHSSATKPLKLITNIAPAQSTILEYLPQPHNLDQIPVTHTGVMEPVVKYGCHIHQGLPDFNWRMVTMQVATGRGTTTQQLGSQADPCPIYGCNALLTPKTFQAHFTQEHRFKGVVDPILQGHYHRVLQGVPTQFSFDSDQLSSRNSLVCLLSYSSVVDATGQSSSMLYHPFVLLAACDKFPNLTNCCGDNWLMVFWLVGYDTAEPLRVHLTIHDAWRNEGCRRIIRPRHISESQDPHSFVRNSNDYLLLARPLEKPRILQINLVIEQ